MSPDRILRLEDWPAADRAMWHHAVQAGGLFDDAGPLAHLSAPTLDMIRVGYGKWLAWLAGAEPEALTAPPAERLTPARLVAFAEALAELSPKSRHLYAANTLRLVAGCHPDRDWTVVDRVVTHLRREAEGHVSRRKDGRILAGGHVLAKGLELAGPIADAGGSAVQRALRQRTGTLIAFLALIPIRRRALTGLRLGVSVVLEEEEAIRIVTPPELTKTKTYWETLVPPALMPVLRRYIDETRPWLMAQSGRSHDHLWVTKDGDPLTGTAMGTLIRLQTRKLFGVDLSPHLFRDIAATTLARSSPEAVGHVRALLGHRGHQTAEKYYNHATALEVGRTHARGIDAIRKRQ